MSSLIRLTAMEDNFVKYAIGKEDHSIMVTLMPSKDFDDEMEMRFSILKTSDRWMIRGHRSIMDNWSFEKFAQKAEKSIKNWGDDKQYKIEKNIRCFFEMNESKLISHLCINQVSIYGEEKEINKVKESKWLTVDIINEKSISNLKINKDPYNIGLYFETEKNPPTDLFKNLTKQFPEIEMQCYWVKEGRNSMVYCKKGEIL